MSDFIEVDVESLGISMRWKAAGPTREVRELEYESEDGLSGRWQVFAVGDDDSRSTARVSLVEDSSDGEVLLVHGGAAGIELEHASGARERQPYLLLSRSTRLV